MIQKLKYVFMGTPDPAARVLRLLLSEGSAYAECVGVVSQPPARSSRSKENVLSAVHTLAIESELPVWTPDKIGSPDSVEQLKSWAPDLCITAAYGQYLPLRVLNIARLGTLNIHPSLLPRYRGAAPVQRTLLAGDKETGVTLLMSVREMDAGPIVSQLRKPLNGDEVASDLLKDLVDMGARELVRIFSTFEFETLAAFPTVPQSQEGVVHAPKIDPSESSAKWNEGAVQVHNQVRGLNLWPGTKAKMKVGNTVVEFKLLKTRLHNSSESNLDREKLSENIRGDGSAPATSFPKMRIAKEGKKVAFRIEFETGPDLEILEIQPVGKRAMSVGDYANSLGLEVPTLEP